MSQFIEKNHDSITALLPDARKLASLEAALLLEARRNPKLNECEPRSVIQSAIECMRMDLQPGPAGECYLVPYYNKDSKSYLCQFQIGYKGKMKLAYKSGLVKSIRTYFIYDGDECDLSYGTENTIQHKPKFQSDKIMAVYAVAELQSGANIFRVLTMGQIKEAENASRSKQFWKNGWETMARKTVINRLLGELPLISGIEEGFKSDSQGYASDDDDQYLVDAEYVEEAPDAAIDAVIDEPAALEPPKTTRKKKTKTQKLTEDMKNEPPGPEQQPTNTGEMTVEDWCRAIKDAEGEEDAKRICGQAQDALPDDTEVFDEALDDHWNAE